MVDTLLGDARLQPQLVAFPGRAGDEALAKAAGSGHLAVVQRLLKHPRIAFSPAAGDTALVAALEGVCAVAAAADGGKADAEGSAAGVHSTTAASSGAVVSARGWLGARLWLTIFSLTTQ